MGYECPTLLMKQYGEFDSLASIQGYTRKAKSYWPQWLADWF